MSLGSGAMERLISEHDAEYGNMLIEYLNAGMTENEAREKACRELEVRHGDRRAAAAAQVELEAKVNQRKTRWMAVMEVLERHCPPGQYPDYEQPAFEREVSRQMHGRLEIPHIDALRHLIPFTYRASRPEVLEGLQRMIQREAAP